MPRIASTISPHKFNVARIFGRVVVALCLLATSLYAQINDPSDVLGNSNGQSVVPFEELPSSDLIAEVDDPLSQLLVGMNDFSDGTRQWFTTDALVFWRKGMRLPVLATDGAVGNPRTLFGGRMVGKGGSAGGRLNFGYWLNPEQTVAIGGSFLILGEKSSNYDSTGEPTVVRPFLVGGVENVLAVNVPPGTTGRFVGSTKSDFIMSEVFVQQPFWTNGATRLDLMSGYMLTRIDESVTLRHQFTDGITNFDGTDFFMTKNKFHGVLLGLVAQTRVGRFHIKNTFKLGLGNMRQTVIINGSNLTGLGANGSLLALSSNGGLRKRDQFSAVREIGTNIVYDASNQVEIAFGYTALFFKHVSQPGEHIVAVRPSPPQIQSIDGNYVVHGLNLTFTIKR